MGVCGGGVQIKLMVSDEGGKILSCKLGKHRNFITFEFIHGRFKEKLWGMKEPENVTISFSDCIRNAIIIILLYSVIHLDTVDSPLKYYRYYQTL